MDRLNLVTPDSSMGTVHLLQEIGKLITKALASASEQGLTLWLVEEETGASIKLYDYLNSAKGCELAEFKRLQ